MSDIMWKRFYDVLSESVNNKDNNFYLTSEFNYDSFTGEKYTVSSHNTMLFSFPIPFT